MQVQNYKHFIYYVGSVNYEEKIEHVFQAIKSNINEDVVRRIQAVFQFNVKGIKIILFHIFNDTLFYFN